MGISRFSVQWRILGSSELRYRAFFLNFRKIQQTGKITQKAGIPPYNSLHTPSCQNFSSAIDTSNKDKFFKFLKNILKRNSYPVGFVEFRLNKVTSSAAAFRKMINFQHK